MKTPAAHLQAMTRFLDSSQAFAGLDVIDGAHALLLLAGHQTLNALGINREESMPLGIRTKVPKEIPRFRRTVTAWSSSSCSEH